MIKIAGRLFSITVGVCIALHIVWAWLILFDGSALNSTALAAIYRALGFGSAVWTAALLCAAALLASWGMVTRRPWIVVLLLPQQALLLISAVGSIEAIWAQQFADGVVRPAGFIAADQIDSVLLAAGHTAALVSHWFRLTEV